MCSTWKQCNFFITLHEYRRKCTIIYEKDNVLGDCRNVFLYLAHLLFIINLVIGILNLSLSYV